MKQKVNTSPQTDTQTCKCKVQVIQTVFPQFSLKRGSFWIKKLATKTHPGINKICHTDLT